METSSLEFWTFITIFSSLVSGIIGVVISVVYHRRSERRREKLETLKRFCGYRYDIKGEQFTRSLNEIFVVFQDSKPVLDKLREFHEVIVSGRAIIANDRLIALFKAMCKDVNIDPSKYTESFFLKAFNVNQNISS